MSRTLMLWIVWITFSAAGGGFVLATIVYGGNRSFLLIGKTTSGHHQIELALLQQLDQHRAVFDLQADAQRGLLPLDHGHGAGINLYHHFLFLSLAVFDQEMIWVWLFFDGVHLMISR